MNPESTMISESFSKAFESLLFQLKRMTGDLNSLQIEIKKLGSLQDSHKVREEM